MKVTKHDLIDIAFFFGIVGGIILVLILVARWN